MWGDCQRNAQRRIILFDYASAPHSTPTDVNATGKHSVFQIFARCALGEGGRVNVDDDDDVSETNTNFVRMCYGVCGMCLSNTADDKSAGCE